MTFKYLYPSCHSIAVFSMSGSNTKRALFKKVVERQYSHRSKKRCSIITYRDLVWPVHICIFKTRIIRGNSKTYNKVKFLFTFNLNILRYHFISVSIAFPALIQ